MQIGTQLILKDVSASIPKHSFTVLLGNNGAGKTTLIDCMMGFKFPTGGRISVLGFDPGTDPHESRQKIAYLSEKVDLPGDWSVDDFLAFHRYFYHEYSRETEIRLLDMFGVDPGCRISTLSAGELRRVQIAAALAIQPEVIIVDEITAVLDIVGRHKFMAYLAEEVRKKRTTVFLATNILEDLTIHATHLLLLKTGEPAKAVTMTEFLDGLPENLFSRKVATYLEAA